MTRRRPLAIPAIIAAGIRRAEKERRANVIARPMRNLMDMLKQGEVYEIDGRAVMRMPEIDEQLATRAEWVEIAPAIDGWRDCWQRLAPDISTYYLSVGSSPALRFEELNVWKQCAPCNNHLSGNAVLYRRALVELIGPEKVEWLEGPHQPKKYTIDDLKAIKAEYIKKRKEIEVCLTQ